MIRFAERRDIGALLHLLDQVNRVHHEGRPDLFRRATKYGAAELEAILEKTDSPVFVFEDENGEILGHAFCLIRQVQGDRLLCDRKELYIDDICVEESSRKKGVGTALYQFVEAYAKELGCYHLTLNVWTCNPGAAAFYERMGLLPQKICMERIL